ncbi:epoxide hydrolase family protein [Micromonospora sp. DT43]|uniref:epoxide hydrolase family protein n=1 Tax=Micromonospora sp. DT43 TaxID=3393440 RepID=UPI003CF3AF04
MQPFRVQIPEAQLNDLSRRLAEARWPEKLPDVGWERGVPTSYLKNLVDYWRTDFDWRAVEARLNGYPQYTADFDGTTIYFMHVRSPEPGAMPMIMTHGWPGSVVEFLDVIGPLTDPRAHGGDPADAFHLVVPSLPGFGFSGPNPNAGWNNLRTAQAWAELMRRLGYDRYLAQAADFGTGVSLTLAGVDEEHVAGVHLNTLPTPPSGDPGELDNLDDEDRARLARSARFVRELAGSMKLQATRPHTVAYALTDSPIGQLAWIAEKYKDWTDSASVPEDAVNRDRLLAIASIYWFTGTAGSSAQFYYEIAENLPINVSTGRYPAIKAPLGVAVFPHAPFVPIRRFADRDFPSIVHWNEFDRGGNFAALEEPDLFIEDVRAFRRLIKE